jgi:hypothetical protein
MNWETGETMLKRDRVENSHYVPTFDLSPGMKSLFPQSQKPGNQVYL